MSDPVEAVLLSNRQFYRVLSLADAAAMRAIWVKSDEAICLHPGWHKLIGYRSIQQSWAVVFVNQGPMHVWPTHEVVSEADGLLWVTCVENIDASNTVANKIICVQARNAFCETDFGWKLLHHLAEAIPDQDFQPTNQRLAAN